MWFSSVLQLIECLSKLKELNISYQIVYTDRNPLILDFKNKNKYKDFVIKTKSNNELKNKPLFLYTERFI